MSPEVKNNSLHGKPSDVWGLGCILYELIDGPHKGDFQQGLSLQLHKDCLHVSGDLHNLIDSMLDKEANKRPASAEVLTRVCDIERNLGVSAPRVQALVQQLTASEERIMQRMKDISKDKDIQAKQQRLKLALTKGAISSEAKRA